ncbi:MAG: glucosamine-6-phosphate deaminase [Bacteroidota bacterium]|jgi:glucosamine-6-phosphate deaminase|nr:glucosamine-6-phosphate deaminase [Chitinophagia bacterium]
MIDAFEKIPVEIHENNKTAAKAIALEIASLIRQKAAEGKNCVLGMATGSTPKTLYAELVRMHKEEGLSFKNVISFNLDEYFPMKPDAPQSYHTFMHKQLFDHVDILPENIHIPDGTIEKSAALQYAAAYEAAITKVGGIDYQILGIGLNGHIGFNEPGSSRNSGTRIIALDNSTRLANAYEFSSIAEVPRLALTMGISNILQSRKIVLLAFGESKASIIKDAVEGQITDNIPATFLQEHSNTIFHLDEASASKLTRYDAPWLTGQIEWNEKLIRKAVCSMAMSLKKPLLMLTREDYHNEGLSELVENLGGVSEANLRVFNGLRDTITGWPGGKPMEDVPRHPERRHPASKRVIIFSPHPDDDIISMGGTFMRLVQQGHDVHVGYQTSGNIAVSDEFVMRQIDFAVEFDGYFEIDKSLAGTIWKDAASFIKTKLPHQKDTPEIRSIKGMIRRTEARATCRYVGVKDENIHFMNLPFYETGLIKKNPPSEEDIQIHVDLIKKVRPHQIFAAGDFADPHGTHKVCFDVMYEALKRLKAAGDPAVAECRLWLYRGAWAEWNVWELDMAIPMSPDQVLQKRNGIFIHQSQKDGVVFQGTDSREFWQRAEDRNSGTARLFDCLGLPQYAALEAFMQYEY